MRITVRFSSGTRADNLDIEKVLVKSLQRFQHRLAQVYVCTTDLNGPRGGIVKQCRCVLHLRRMPAVVIQDQDECMTSLIHRVANRAAYIVSQRVDRRAKRVLQNRKDRRRMHFHPANK